jgi:hypothetical protein
VFLSYDAGGNRACMTSDDHRSPSRVRSLEYAAPEASSLARLSPQVLVLFLVGLGLSVLSVALVLKAAYDEPFYGEFSWGEGALFVGGGVALIAGWVAWAAVVVWLVARRGLHRAFLAGLLWPALGSLFVSAAPVGFLEDRAAFDRMTRQATPTGGVGGR